VVVLDARGDLIALVEKNVQRFTFCCGPDKLALVLGETREGGEFGFTPEAALVVDIRTGEETPVDVPAPYGLSWASFDSSLYIQSRPSEGPVVYRYEPGSGSLSVTSHRGVQFSPDGKYYLDDPSEDRFRLYRSDDDRDVTTNLPTRFRGFWSTGWVPGAGHILVFSEADAPSPPRKLAPPAGRRRDVVISGTPDRRHLRNYFVDAETGQVIDTSRGEWLRGWSTNANAVLVSAQEGIRLLRPRVK
jgi:hypothetical protein